MPKEKHNAYTNQAFKNSVNLRKNMTSEERILWHTFLKTLKPRFRRQKPIGNYVADFYCREKKLIIEIDGSQHYEDDAILYDKKRTDYFKSIGLDILRFTNLDIKLNLNDVCNMILYELNRR
ncbi:MAG: endonuclease domain-containing protein [Firmicutes bacterium]|nr:endonuclease domain-containing protein [Bacillota bacterium]